jgi:cell division septal protein FtsQ
MIRQRSQARKVLGTLALSCIPILLVNSALFSVRTVQVTGVTAAQERQLLPQVNHLRGHNLLRMTLQDVQGVFGAVGWIQDVGIRKILPGKLLVTLTARRPVGFWSDAKGEALVDASGHLYIGGPADAAGLVITGPAKRGDLGAVAEFLSANPDLAARLSVVELGAPSGTVFQDRFGHRLLIDLSTARKSLELFEHTIRECPVFDGAGLVDVRRPGRFIILG